MIPPPGWIPPEFREEVFADSLDADDIAAIKATMFTFDPETGQRLSVTDEEISERGIRRITGVRDTRDGSYHPNKYFKD